MSRGDEFFDALAEAVASKVAASLPAPAPGSPWMQVEEAAEYSRIALGTFRQLSAEGKIPSHSAGRRRLYHRDEVDEALLGYARTSKVTTLRRAS